MPIEEKIPDVPIHPRELEKLKGVFDEIKKPLPEDSTMVVDGVGHFDSLDIEIPVAGDQVTREGYIWKYNIKVCAGMSGIIPVGKTMSGQAERIIEQATYFTVEISKNKDTCSSPVTFRISGKDRLGEKLAMTMGVIATVKDAFIHKKKVKVQGKVNERFEVDGIKFVFVEFEMIEITNS